MQILFPRYSLGKSAVLAKNARLSDIGGCKKMGYQQKKKNIDFVYTKILLYMKGEYIMKTHIISGIASIFGGENNDYKSLYHKYVERPADEVNREAILSDWQTVGDDIWQAINKYEADTKEARK